MRRPWPTGGGSVAPETNSPYDRMMKIDVTGNLELNGDS